eukprot:40055_1
MSLKFTVFLCCVMHITFAYPKDNLATFDCPMRQTAMEFASYIQPWLTQQQMSQIADALTGSSKFPCNLTHYPNNNNTYWNPLQTTETSTHKIIFVDAKFGNDLTNEGTINSPFKTLAHTLKISRMKYGKNILKKIVLRSGRYYLKNTLHFNSNDSNLMITSYNNEKVDISGAIPINCDWKISSINKNIYECQIQQYNNITDELFLGLRINGSRAIRARYPNGNPETDGFGSTLNALSWVQPTLPKLPDFNIYPDNPTRNISTDGQFDFYTLGIGGPCNNFVPNAGFFCSELAGGGNQGVYTVPSGLRYNKTILPNTPYKNIAGAVIHCWRPSHWCTWMFDIGENDINEQTFLFSRGGFQGARGNRNGEHFYIENVMEELDSPTEWFYNTTTRILYYYNNASQNINPNDILFE